MLLGAKNLQDAKFSKVDGYAGIDAKLSLGASGNADIVGTYTGTNGTVKDQLGVKAIGPDGIPVNVAGCYELCVGFGTNLDTATLLSTRTAKPTSVTWGTGYGKGVDVSVDVLSFSDYGFYFDGNGNNNLQIPYITPIWNWITGGK